MAVSRWRATRLVTAAALIVSLVPVSTVSAGVIADEQAAAVSSAVAVDAYAQHDGIMVRARSLERVAKSIDVFRSTEAGVKGDKLNSSPIEGYRYLDASAKPEVRYFYTVEVAETVSADVAAPVLSQVEAQVLEAATPRPSAPRVPDAGATTIVSVSESFASRASVGSAALQVAPAGVTTLTANTTWTPSNGPYFIRNDLVVPKGKTLTILPGTEVYFDSAISGNGDPGTSDNPTDRVDLIVHGRLLANGTSTSPIRFDSIRSMAESATESPSNPGDWGCIYTDSKAASSISRASIEFALRGVHANRTARPYVSYCAIRGIQQEAIFFEDPVVDVVSPRPQFIGNTISDSSSGIVVEWSVEAQDSAATTLDPVISKNSVNADPALALRMYEQEEPAGRGTVTLKGTVSGNTFSGSESLMAKIDGVVRLEAAAGGQYGASVSTAFSGNRITSRGGRAMGVMAENRGTGAASVRPTFTSDFISGSAGAIDAVASCDSRIETVTASAIVAPKFAKTTLRSTSTSAFLMARNSGAGAASATGSWSGGSVYSGEETALYALADATWGAATASPVLTGTQVESGGPGNALYTEARSAHAGYARSAPSVTGGSVVSAQAGAVLMYVRSAEGDAFATPAFVSTDLEAAGDVIGFEAQASADASGTGDANGSFMMIDSSAVSNGGDVVQADVRAYTTGEASLNPRITDSALLAEGGEAMRAYVDSAKGAVASSPALVGDVVRSLASCLHIEAVGSASAEATRLVEISPRMADSVLQSKSSAPVYLRGFNNGPGDVDAVPVASGCTVLNELSANAIDIEAAAGSGSVDVSPDISYTDISSEYDALFMRAWNYTPGHIAKIGGSVRLSKLRSTWDNAVDALAESAGSAEMRTAFVSDVASAPSAAAYNLVSFSSGAAGEGARSAPVVSGGYVSGASGVYVEAHGAYTTPASALADPQVKNCSVIAPNGFGIETFAFSEGTGSAVNRAYIYNVATRSSLGIANSAYAVGDVADASVGAARCDARVLGVSALRRMNVVSTLGTGVDNGATADGGSAYNNSQVKYVDASAAGNGIRVSAIGNGPASSVQSHAVISDNVVSGDWLSRRFGIRAVMVGNEVSDSTVISGNRVTDCARDGIQYETSASTAATNQPTITGNTVLRSGENGIGVYDRGDAHSSSAFSLTKNSVNSSGWNSVYISALPFGTVEQNRMYLPGTSPGGGVDRACLYWSGASISSKVRGNMFAGARAAAVWYEGSEAPATTFNSFGDTSGVVNRPYNYATTADVATVPAFNATYNWWGTASPTVISDALFAPAYVGDKADLIDSRFALTSCQARVTKITVAKSGSKRTFKVYFDRPMDRSASSLYLGKTPGAKTYRVRGAWNVSGTSFTGTYTGTLPVNVRLYFTGAKDLPGSLMLSSSRYIRL